MASLTAPCALAIAGVTREARAVVTSLMLVEAKPMPAVTANTNVISQTAQPTNAVARCPLCHRPAAQDGITSATRSAATPTARKSHPAISLDPSERANQPLMVMPTTARASAAIDNSTEARCLRAGAAVSSVGCDLTVG